MEVSAHSNLRYTKTHEWARRDGDLVAVGITAYAVQQLSDIAYVNLPKVGNKQPAAVQGQRFGEIESTKAVEDLNAPVCGVIVEVNAALPDHLDWLTSDPYGTGWMIKIRPSNSDQIDGLMTAEAYQEFCATIEH